MRRFSQHPDPEQGEVIATFGEAKLIKLPDRKYELVGGSEADLADAQAWISMFMKGDLVRGVSDQQ